MTQRVSYRIGKSRTGRGLFAAVPIAHGERVVEYTGTRIPTTQADSLTTRYLFDLEDGTTIDGSIRTNVARWINHSCVPNCESVNEDGRIFIHTLRDIKAGEEFTMDYGDEYFDAFIRPTGCKCERCSDGE